MSTFTESSWVEAGKMAGRAVMAAGRVAMAAVKGQEVLVPMEMAKERLALCEVCPWMKRGVGPAEGFWVCLKCGCGLNGRVKCKAFLATESCPEKKWLRL